MWKKSGTESFQSSRRHRNPDKVKNEWEEKLLKLQGQTQGMSSAL
jgi:hypothetical protein